MLSDLVFFFFLSTFPLLFSSTPSPNTDTSQASAFTEAPEEEQSVDDTDGAFMEQFFTNVKTIRDQTREIVSTHE